MRPWCCGGLVGTMMDLVLQTVKLLLVRRAKPNVAGRRWWWELQP